MRVTTRVRHASRCVCVWLRCRWAIANPVLMVMLDTTFGSTPAKVEKELKQGIIGCDLWYPFEGDHIKRQKYKMLGQVR